MPKRYETWKLEEFIAYLYLSIANADLDISDDEMDIIKRKFAILMKEHFPEVEFDELTLLSNFRIKISEPVISNREDVVAALADKFHFSKEFRRDLLIDLNEIISSDENVTPSEHELFRYVRGCLA